MKDDEIKKLVEEKTSSLLSHDDLRERVCRIFDGQVDSVTFMKKIQEYASEEIDKRTYKSFKFWLTFIATPVVATLTTIVITSLILS